MSFSERFILESNSAALAAFREKVRSLLARSVFSEKQQSDLLTALGEACTNSICHSYHEQPGHKIEVTIEDYPDKMVFSVQDDGEKIDLSKVKNPDLPPQKGHGLGLFFIRTIMDEIEYNTDLPQGNLLKMIKYKKIRL